MLHWDCALGSPCMVVVEHNNVIYHANVTQQEQMARNHPVEKMQSNTVEVQAHNVWMSDVDKPRSKI